MRIFDIENNEITNPDLELGYLKEEKLLIANHPAIEAVEEQWHYEYKVYPNGGQDRTKVIDVPGVIAVEAWDEYEDIQRYILYTEEELKEIEAERNKPTPQDDTDAMLVDHEYRLTMLELGLTE